MLGLFRLQGHNLNKHGRSPLDNIKALGLVVSDKKVSFMFSLYNMLYVLKKVSYVKLVTPGRNHFWPQGYNLNKVGNGPLGDATYQITKL